MQITPEKREEIRREVESSLNRPTYALKRHQRDLIVMNNLLSLWVYWGATIIFWAIFGRAAIMSFDNNPIIALILSTGTIGLFCAVGAFLGSRPTEKGPAIFVIAPTALISLLVTAYFLLSPSVIAPVGGGELSQFLISYCKTLIPSLGYLSAFWRGEYALADMFVFLVMLFTALFPVLGYFIGVFSKQKYLEARKGRASARSFNCSENNLECVQPYPDSELPNERGWWFFGDFSTDSAIPLIAVLLVMSMIGLGVYAVMN